MHRRDIELLAKLANVNKSAGIATLELRHLQPNDAAYGQSLRELGERLVGLGNDLTARADELACQAIEQTGRDIERGEDNP
ncbi:hypothetical protein [Amycolatopsis sp. cmx-11-51]|uniref:hypothetical protein n=1 Tax=Amycolatopsis sp. cmx-11-51 TaxID=2785797 RepID=UPI0039E6B9B9